MSTIIGAHSMIHSTNPDADRYFLRDVLKLTHVDAGGGFLIFGLPAAEVHIQVFVADMRKSDISCSPVQDQGWGLLTQMTLPGGGKLGVYQPRHARPRGLAR
jgi:hypothetical protein